MNIDFDQMLGTELEAISPLADAFAQWAQDAAVPVRHVFQTNVVLEELITNAIVHGLGEGNPGWISVRVRRQGDTLEIELRDSAPPFDPFGVPPPSLMGDIEERDVGGLGVHFVRTLMDEWRYAREGDQNVVRLRKAVMDNAP